jgi:hypothetical protein
MAVSVPGAGRNAGGVGELQWLTGADGTPGPAMSACLQAATEAPSVHNTQPWLFRLHGSAVDVLLDRSRQLPVADPDGRELHVSVGAALFNLRTAMHAQGRQPVVRLLPDPDRPDLAATVSVGAVSAVPDHVRALAEAIPHRQTNRRPFWSTPALEAAIGKLVAAAQAEGGRLVMLDPATRQTVLDAVRSAESRLRSDPGYRTELAAWTTTATSTRDDGVPVAAFGTRAELAALPIRDFDLDHTSDRPVAPYETDPTIAVLYSPGDSPRDWLTAGQILERILLTATANSVAAAPLTQAIEVPHVRKLLHDGPGPMVIQSVLRLGYAGAGPRAPRRPLTDVLVRQRG